jgi:hypothetical protein
LISILPSFVLPSHILPSIFPLTVQSWSNECLAHARSAVAKPVFAAPSSSSSTTGPNGLVSLPAHSAHATLLQRFALLASAAVAAAAAHAWTTVHNIATLAVNVAASYRAKNLGDKNLGDKNLAAGGGKALARPLCAYQLVAAAPSFARIGDCVCAMIEAKVRCVFVSKYIYILFFYASVAFSHDSDDELRARISLVEFYR